MTTLREARKNMGLTQLMLGSKVGLSQTQIRKIENGHAIPQPLNEDLFKEVLRDTAIVFPERGRRTYGTVKDLQVARQNLELKIEKSINDWLCKFQAQFEDISISEVRIILGDREYKDHVFTGVLDAKILIKV